MKSIPAARVACFAGEDLNRWRLLIQARVVHCDPRWGGGRVVDVQWQAKDDGLIPRGSIFLRVVYDNGLRASINTRSLAPYLETVEVPEPLAELLDDCFGPEGAVPEDPECTRRIEAFDRDLRDRLDAERLRRASELERRVSARRKDRRSAE